MSPLVQSSQHRVIVSKWLAVQVKLALCQMLVTADKDANIQRAVENIEVRLARYIRNACHASLHATRWHRLLITTHNIAARHPVR